jgi:hypothetical protein
MTPSATSLAKTLSYFRAISICCSKGYSRRKLLPVPDGYKVQLQDIEIAGIIAAHLAWGRRAMILRDTGRAMDEMHWKPYEYVMAGKYRNEDKSLHRTVKWSEFAMICGNLRKILY